MALARQRKREREREMGVRFTYVLELAQSIVEVSRGDLLVAELELCESVLVAEGSHVEPQTVVLVAHLQRL
jgi:hypothetical protein